MNSIPQRTLEYNIGLVKYENPNQKDGFDMTTIHSLLIDQNPKFIELCQLVTNYNSKQSKREVGRPHLQRNFIERLYKMLSQLTRIPISQNQLKFLNKIYAWAFQEQTQNDGFNSNNNFDQKVRPSTASTRTRPYSVANTRVTRPDSGVTSKPLAQAKKIQQGQKISKKTMQQYPGVDFKQLKHGQAQFFLGHRTLHPEQQIPRVRLKQYQRKIIYDQPDEHDKKFEQFVQQKKKVIKKQKIQAPLIEQINIQDQLIQGQAVLGENVEGEPGQGQDGVGPGQEDINIDDLGAVGQQGGQPVAQGQQEQVQVIDKLKPRIKAYGDSLDPIPYQNRQNLHKGYQKQFQERNKLVRKVQQDQINNEIMQKWAGAKNRVKIQQRRRAQSARIATKLTGKQFQKYIKKKQQNSLGANVIDLTTIKTSEIKSDIRPKTAFKAQSDRAFNESLANAKKIGQLGRHVKLEQNNFINDQKFQQLNKLGTFAAKPKKKTFQEILREAQQKVNNQVKNQIELVKQTLTNNNIALGANRIYKSLSYHEHELYDGDFVGQVTGQGMIKNPFIKVAKKKKKKKKK